MKNLSSTFHAKSLRSLQFGTTRDVSKSTTCVSSFCNNQTLLAGANPLNDVFAQCVDIYLAN